MAFADAQSGGYVRHDATGVVAITLAGTASKGDILGYSSGWVRALATAGTAIQGICVALESGLITNVIPAAFGTCIVGGRISGATAGNRIYVAEGTSNGMYTESVPSTSNDCNTIIGISIAATEILVMPNTLAKTVA